MTGDDSRWSAASTVAGFRGAAPNETLLDFARRELVAGRDGRLLDLGCGAARNAVPLATAGWRVVGLDLSLAMLRAAASRAREAGVAGSIGLARAAMDALPLPDGSCDLVVAHGIWNLARSDGEMRRAIAEAARAARPGAGLFVFTFSRATLPEAARPIAGERFAFTDFAGEPQCFLTADELVAELAAAGFEPDPAVPLRELNRPKGRRIGTGPPVILESSFRRRAPAGSR
jgi:SAM-dependent methyltransferase